MKQLATSLKGALRPDEINYGIKVILKKKGISAMCFFFNNFLIYSFCLSGRSIQSLNISIKYQYKNVKMVHYMSKSCIQNRTSIKVQKYYINIIIILLKVLHMTLLNE